MAPPNGLNVYNSQLVGYLLALHHFHNAEYTTKDAFELYHIVQEESAKATPLIQGPALPALGHAAAGSLATATTKLLLYPLDLVVTRLQVQKQLRGPREAPSAASEAGAEYASFIDAARKIYRNEGGLGAFYTGCGPDVAKSIADSFLFFLAYTFLRHRQLQRDGTKHLSVSKELGVGMAAGAFARFLTTPIQNIVTRQQTAAMVAARDPTATVPPEHADQLTVKDIALQIRSERGIRGFWAGYGASLILTFNPAITFAMQRLFERLLPRSQRAKPAPQTTFLIAALSKAIATSITYPISLAKSRAQVSTPSAIADSKDADEKGGEPSTAAQSSQPQRRRSRLALARLLGLFKAQYAILVSIRRIYQREGLTGLYSGLEAEVLRGFLSHGLTMMMKDGVHLGVIQVYYALLKLSRRWPDDLKVVKNDLSNRAENISVTLAEGAKNAVQEGKKAVGASS